MNNKETDGDVNDNDNDKGDNENKESGNSHKDDHENDNGNDVEGSRKGKKGHRKHNKKHHNHSKHNNEDLSESEEEEEEKKKKHQQHKEEKKNLQDIIAEYYVLLSPAGKGAFGEIFLSYNLREKLEVAIKKERKRPQKPSQLKIEAKLYQSLLNIPSNAEVSGSTALKQEDVQGVPRFYGVGDLFDFYYLIMEFLGPNLGDLFNFCQTKKLTISTVCLIALQMMNRIENIHKHQYLHRDLKPENFVIGSEDKSNVIYLIDFGLSKRYKNPKNHQHIPYREGRPLAGTARYVSINTHLGVEQSRRDDLESIGYVLVYFMKGSLPWQGLKGNNEKYIRIMEKKLQIPTEILCYGLPEEMIHYLNYCKSLRFEDRPDYDYLRGLFIKLLSNCCSLYGLTKDFLKFDWCFEDSSVIWKLFAKGKGNTNQINSSMMYGKKQSNSNLGDRKINEDMGNNITPMSFAKSPLKLISEKKITNQLAKIEEKVAGENQVNTIEQGNNLLGLGMGSSKGDKVSFQKSNENNPCISIESSANDSHSSNDDDDKEKDSNSEETIEVKFKGETQVNFINEKMTQKEIEDLVLVSPNEDIDDYIMKLINDNSLIKAPTKKVNVQFIDCNDQAQPEPEPEEEGGIHLKVYAERVKNKQSSKTNYIKSEHSHESSDSDININEDKQENKETMLVGAKNNKIKLKDSLDITGKSQRSYASITKKEKDCSPKKKNVSASVIYNPNQNINELLIEKKQSESDSDSSELKSPVLLDNTRKNSKIGLSDKEAKELSLLNQQKKKEALSLSLVPMKKEKSEAIVESLLKKSKDNNGENTMNNIITIHKKQANVKEETKLDPNSIGSSFEKQLMPKISGPEFKERRKSKILDINNLPIQQVDQKFKFK